MRALEVAHALGSNTLSGVTYATIGYTSGSPPAEQEYANIARALAAGSAARGRVTA